MNKKFILNISILDENNNFFQVTSPEPVNYVLEVNSGVCQKYKIMPENKVDINF
ncbi:DUF192 domain-containing protein [Patescibacteria group bacterium]|nr:DUF192 domain-containing protein [Patescibacteria group bacterium]